MELNELKNGVLMLVLIGIILGIGLTILGTLGQDIRTATAYTNDQINVTNTTCRTLTNDHISSSTATYVNFTNGVSLSADCFTWDDSDRFQGSCVTLGSSASCQSQELKYVNISYTFGAANTQSDAVDDTSTGIAGFVTWISIIVIVIAASIIVTLVIRSFRA